MVHVTEALLIARPKWGLNKRWKNSRQPFDPTKIDPHPVERTPLRCRNKIRTLGGQQEDVVCIREMLNLFSCMKLNDLNEKDCPDELDAFRKCYTKAIADWKARQLIEDVTEPIPGQTKLSSHQINVLLQRYPQKIDI